MQIRHMQVTDTNTIRSIAHDTWRHTYSDFIPLDIQDKVLTDAYSDAEMDNRFQHYLNLVVEIEQRIVGYAFFSGDRSKEEVYLESLYIHPSHHRKGIGRALIKYGLSCYVRPKTLSLSVYKQNSSISFYEKEGFVKVGETEGDFFGHPVTFIKMSKSI